MKKYFLRFWDTAKIPREAKVLTAVTSIRWIGWGFAESLIPVLLYSFGHTYAQAGLLRAAYDIAFIVTLPLVGVAADRMRATTLVLIGLFLYLFVGTGYLLAGATGAVIFIVLARVFNGVAFAFDAVGRNTCLRRHTPSGALATVSGFHDTVANFWWIAAALAGIFLVKYFSISVLLFLITPAAALSMLILAHYRKKKIERRDPVERSKISYLSFFREMDLWDWKLKGLLLFSFFISFTGAIVAFFLPIQAFVSGDGLSFVILMGVVTTIPTLFSWQLGKLFDGKGMKLFAGSLIVFAALVLSLVFWHHYMWQLIVLFMTSLIIELLSLGTNEMVTVYARPEHFGRVDGLVRSISDIGSMVGPLVLGVIMDGYGVPTAYAVLATVIGSLAVVFYSFERRSRPKTLHIEI